MRACLDVADTMLRLGKRGNEVWQALKPLPEVPISQAAYFAWQKQWDAGEVTDLASGSEV